MGLFSFFALVFRIIMDIIGWFLNLKDLWEEISGKNGKKEQRCAWLQLILFFPIAIWIACLLSADELNECIAAIKSSKTVLNSLWILLKGSYLTVLIALVFTVFLYKLCNFIYFHVGRKDSGRMMAGKREPITYKDIKAMEKRRENK